jgi:hypothetical protein
LRIILASGVGGGLAGAAGRTVPSRRALRRRRPGPVSWCFDACHQAQQLVMEQLVKEEIAETPER